MESPEYPALAGSFVVGLRTFLPDVIGPEAAEKVVASLPANLSEELVATTSVGWGSIEMMCAVVDGAAEVTGRDPLEINRAITEHNMRRTIGGVWRILLKAATDRIIIKRAPSLYTQAYNRGEISSTWIEKGHARLTIEAWPDVHDYTLQSGAVALELLLQHAGRSNVRVVTTRTPQGAELDVRWE